MPEGQSTVTGVSNKGKKYITTKKFKIALKIKQHPNEYQSSVVRDIHVCVSYHTYASEKIY